MKGMGMRSIAPDTVPHALTEAQKLNRINRANDCLALYDNDPAMLETLLTMDEVWLTML